MPSHSRTNYTKEDVSNEVSRALLHLNGFPILTANDFIDFLFERLQNTPTTESRIRSTIREGIRTGVIREEGGFFSINGDNQNQFNSMIQRQVPKSNANRTSPRTGKRAVKKPIKRLVNTCSRRPNGCIKSTTTRRVANAGAGQRNNIRSKKNSRSQCDKCSATELARARRTIKKKKKVVRRTKTKRRVRSRSSSEGSGSSDRGSNTSVSTARSSSERSGSSDDQSSDRSVSITTDCSDISTGNRGNKQPMRQSRSLERRSRKGKSRKSRSSKSRSRKTGKGRRRLVGRQRSSSSSSSCTNRSSFRSRTPTKVSKRQSGIRSGNPNTPKRGGNESNGDEKTGKENNSNTDNNANQNANVNSLPRSLSFIRLPDSTDNGSRLQGEGIDDGDDYDEEDSYVTDTDMNYREEQGKPDQRYMN